MFSRFVIAKDTLKLGLLVSTAMVALPLNLSAQETLEVLKKSMVEQIDNANTETIFKKADLVKKYVTALDTLEKSLTASGKLDQIVHLREERALVQKSGETSSHQDKELVDLRDKYMKGMAAIDASLVQVQSRIAAEIAIKGKAGEAALTKAGKIDEALAYRKDLQQLLIESGGATSTEVPFKEDPRVSSPSQLKELEAIKLPIETPPSVDDPFANPTPWLESLTVKAAKQKLKKPIVLGDRSKQKWPIICVSPGSQWAADDGGKVIVSAARFAATRSRFQKVVFEAELDCYTYFMNSVLDDCRIQRGGVWYGWDMGAKFYFDKCLIKGSFAKDFDIGGVSLRVQNSVLSGVDFPTFYFNQKQPAEFLNHKWLKFVNCRFVKCTLPVNVILLTRDCIFEECTFIDNSTARANQAPITTPIEIILYTDRCRTRISALPGAVKLTEKPANALKAVEIPTVSMLESLLGQ